MEIDGKVSARPDTYSRFFVRFLHHEKEAEKVH